MNPNFIFDELVSFFRQLPGLGARSAERIALHLLVEKKDKAYTLIDTLKNALDCLSSCNVCGNLSQEDLCLICQDTTRDLNTLTVVEKISDLLAMERSQVYRGLYHVLGAKLSPLHDIGPEQLNLNTLLQRLQKDNIKELILALPNDIEGEATCHFLQTEIIPSFVNVSRIGFGLPTGSTLSYADPITLRSALNARRCLSQSILNV